MMAGEESQEEEDADSAAQGQGRGRHYGAGGGMFSDGEDDEGNASDESHESWKSWRDEGTDAAQERLRVQRAVRFDSLVGVGHSLHPVVWT